MNNYNTKINRVAIGGGCVGLVTGIVLFCTLGKLSYSFALVMAPLIILESLLQSNMVLFVLCFFYYYLVTWLILLWAKRKAFFLLFLFFVMLLIHVFSYKIVLKSYASMGGSIVNYLRTEVFEQ